MKKQISPSIKAYLIRGAFYLLLLVAVCAIPFALAQRHVGKSRFPGTKGRHNVERPQGTCPTPWAFVADMPVDIEYNAGASDGTYFYSISGYSFSAGDTVGAVYRYNPGTNSWATMASIPLPVLGHAVVYYPPTNKIYAFGGENAFGDNFSNTQIYDIASNSWTAGATMPDVGSFMAAGYVSSTGKIYIISGYNTGFIDSAQDRTWAYDPVANSWTDLSAMVSFPHPAGGFAYGVINNKVYVAGGRDANNANIRLNWEFDPAGPTYTQKPNMPGTQPNQPGSAVALNALFAFGGGNPFAGGASIATKAPSTVNNGAPVSTDVQSRLSRVAFNINRPRAETKDRVGIPLTTNHTYVYDPAANQWTTSADMNTRRSGPGGAFISGSNQIIAAGGFDSSIFFDTVTAEVLTPCIPTPTPTPPPCPTPTPHPPCGLMIGDGLTIGFEPNGYQLIASNIVDYTFSESATAPNDYAIFETHNPWGFTVIKDAITAAGHTYSVFTPQDLAGFNFSQYRVVILNWDDTFLSEFGGDSACGGGGAYINAIPALEAYSAAGGVLWVQGAIQGDFGDCYPLPFGGQSCIDFGTEDPIVNTCNPMVIGVENPIVGDAASHVSDKDLPPQAHVVVINDIDSNPVLYDLTCPIAGPTPTPTPPLGCNTGLIHNGGFETGNFTNWVVDGLMPSPVVTNALAYSGRFSAFVGGNPHLLQFCGFGNSPNGDSSFYQQFGPVPANTTLSFWHWDCNTSFSIDFAWQDAYITDTNGNILQTIYHQLLNCESWVNERVDLSPWAGQTIRVKFLVRQDGFGDLTSMLVDDVGVFASAPCTPTPTPTPRATTTPRPRPTPRSRP